MPIQASGLDSASHRVVAVIPARGGSQGVPGKNVTRVGGVPLVGRAVRSALRAHRVDTVVVSTDDAAISSAALAAGARVVTRPAELANDTASSEAALLHACEEIEKLTATAPQVLVFIQATSPFIDPDEIDAAIERVLGDECDVVFSAVETYEFLWELQPDGAHGINHDRAFRPRRQDREPHFRESGAFYVMDWAGFRETRHRFFGRIGVQPVDERFSLEIDTPEELQIARTIAPLFDTVSLDRSMISGLIMDFDGVHTDDHVYVDSNGVESIRASRSDGLGLAMLRELELPMVVVSKERNPVVGARAAKLGLPVLQGIDDKSAAVTRWANEAGLDLADLMYVGNDVNDLPAMALVGWPVAVSDAHPRVRAAARFILERPGGSGALRELADMLVGNERGKTP